MVAECLRFKIYGIANYSDLILMNKLKKCLILCCCFFVYTVYTCYMLHIYNIYIYIEIVYILKL